MTVAERIYRSRDRFDALSLKLRWRVTNYGCLYVNRFIFVDGSVLVLRFYHGNNPIWFWHVEK